MNSRKIFAGIVLVLLCTICLQQASAAVRLNIRQYGAVGDGVTDDSKAIQDAIDTCWQSGGGVVLVPVSQAPYIITHITVKAHVTLKGDGGILKFRDNICIDATKEYYLIDNITVSGSIITYHSYATLDGLTIEGNGQNNTSFKVGDAVTFCGDHCTIKNCYIKEPPDSGIMLSNFSNALCTGNIIEGGTDCGFYINRTFGQPDTAKTYNSLVSDNVIRNFPQAGIACKRNTSYINLTNNRIVSCGTGIAVVPGTYTEKAGHNILVFNNVIDSCGYGNASTGILLTSCDSVVVSSNQIMNALRYGIQVKGAVNTQIDNNKVTFNKSAAANAVGLDIRDFEYGSTKFNTEGCNVERNHIEYSPSGNAIHTDVDRTQRKIKVENSNILVGHN
ncbi:right-handed parallel beta-helix repeat-containing protein [Chitinophagaceae bacterium MMS25-I14]